MASRTARIRSTNAGCANCAISWFLPMRPPDLGVHRGHYAGAGRDHVQHAAGRHNYALPRHGGGDGTLEAPRHGHSQQDQNGQQRRPALAELTFINWSSCSGEERRSRDTLRKISVFIGPPEAREGSRSTASPRAALAFGSIRVPVAWRRRASSTAASSLACTSLVSAMVKPVLGSENVHQRAESEPVLFPFAVQRSLEGFDGFVRLSQAQARVAHAFQGHHHLRGNRARGSRPPATRPGG